MWLKAAVLSISEVNNSQHMNIQMVKWKMGTKDKEKNQTSSMLQLLCKVCPLLIFFFFTAKSKQDNFLSNHKKKIRWCPWICSTTKAKVLFPVQRCNETSSLIIQESNYGNLYKPTFLKKHPKASLHLYTRYIKNKIKSLPITMTKLFKKTLKLFNKEL